MREVPNRERRKKMLRSIREIFYVYYLARKHFKIKPKDFFEKSNYDLPIKKSRK